MKTIEIINQINIHQLHKFLETNIIEEPRDTLRFGFIELHDTALINTLETAIINFFATYGYIFDLKANRLIKENKSIRFKDYYKIQNKEFISIYIRT